jgi:hypothetical protein
MVKKLPKNVESNQMIQRTNWIKILWYDQNNALNNMRMLPKVCVQNILFELKYKVHKYGIIAPSILFKTIWYQVKSNTMIATKWRFKWNEEAPQGTCKNENVFIWIHFAQYGILTPSMTFKTQIIARDHRKEIKLDTCIKEMVEQQVRMWNFRAMSPRSVIFLGGLLVAWCPHTLLFL